MDKPTIDETASVRLLKLNSEKCARFRLRFVRFELRFWFRFFFLSKLLVALLYPLDALGECPVEELSAHIVEL